MVYTIRQNRLRMAAMIHGNRMTAACEVAHNVSANESGTANNKDSHYSHDHWSSLGDKSQHCAFQPVSQDRLAQIIRRVKPSCCALLPTLLGISSAPLIVFTGGSADPIRVVGDGP